MRTLLTGMISAGCIILAILFFFEHLPRARQIKQNHPTLVIAGGILLIIVTWRALHTILWVVAAGLAPVPLWLLHGALRNTHNLMESSETRPDAFVATPMGQIMQILGLEPRAVNE